MTDKQQQEEELLNYRTWLLQNQHSGNICKSGGKKASGAAAAREREESPDGVAEQGQTPILHWRVHVDTANLVHRSVQMADAS